jgi:hypothetical protein
MLLDALVTAINLTLALLPWIGGAYALLVLASMVWDFARTPLAPLIKWACQ